MKKILISGSSSGIGRAIAERLLSQGDEVIGLARNHQKFQPDASGYHPITVDFNNDKVLESALKTIKQAHPVIDAIICCAGYGQFHAIEQFSWQQMQQMMMVNFTSQAFLMKYFLPALKQQAQGHIIAIGSEAALAGAKQGSMYCASKFALRGFCQSLRKECNTNHIAVSLINPGMVDTEFFSTLDFKPGDDPSNSIDPQHLVDMVCLILNTDPCCVIEEVNLQPLKTVMQKKT